MIRAVADTHAVIWYLYNDARLSPTARTWIEDAAAAGEQSATALYLGLPIISRDRKIQASNLTAVW